MRLFEWKDNRIVISPEAITIRCFKEIWENDKSKDKDKAIEELSLIYFMYDPRSEYQYEIDEKERLSIIKEHIGVSQSWKPSKVFEKAVATYKQLVITSSSKLLASNMKILKKVDDFLNKVMIDDGNINKILKAVSDSNDLAVQIAKSEKEIYREIDEHSDKKRGGGKLSIGDEFDIGNLINV